MAVTCVMKITNTQKKYTQLITRLIANHKTEHQRPSKLYDVTHNNMNVDGGSVPNG